MYLLGILVFYAIPAATILCGFVALYWLYRPHTTFQDLISRGGVDTDPLPADASYEARREHAIDVAARAVAEMRELNETFARRVYWYIIMTVATFFSLFGNAVFFSEAPWSWGVWTAGGILLVWLWVIDHLLMNEARRIPGGRKLPSPTAPPRDV